MIKRVVKIETSKEMVANDINELITGSDIDQAPLEENECVIGYTVVKDFGTWYVLVNIGEE